MVFRGGGLDPVFAGLKTLVADKKCDFGKKKRRGRRQEGIFGRQQFRVAARPKLLPLRLTSQPDRKNKCKSSFLSGVLPFWRLSICTSAFPKSARRCSRHYYLVVGPCPRGRLYSSMMTNLLQASSTDGHAWRMRDVLRRLCGNLPFYFQHSRIHHFALYQLRVAAMTGAMF